MKKIISLVLALCFLGFVLPVNTVKADEVSPKLIIESYLVDDNYELGGDTTVKLTLKNMSNRYTMTDIILSYSSDSTVIPALGTSNQVVIDKIEPGKTAEVTVKVSVIASNYGYAKMSFVMNYICGLNMTSTDKEGKTETTFVNISSYSNSSGYIIFPVANTSFITINSVNVANTTSVGAKAIVGLRYSNPGKESTRDVSMVISYEDKTETVEIGDVKAGDTSYLEHYITFSSEGTKQVNIKLQYENASGKTETLSVGDYSVEVQRANIIITPTPIVDANNYSTAFLSDPANTVILVVVVIILISGLFGFVSYAKRRR